MKIEARPYKKPYINFFAALVAVGVVVFIFTNLAIIPSSFNWQKSDILFSARFTQTATIDAAKLNVRSNKFGMALRPSTDAKC